MKGRFEFRGDEHTCPDYGGVDWRDRYLLYLEQNDMEMPGQMWFIVGDHQQELNEENTFVFQNSVAPELNAVAVIDERDSKPFWWHKLRFGEDYEELVETIGGYACILTTDFPARQVVDAYNYISDGELARELDEF